ncbi:PTS system transporter subunit IIC [Streptococcus pneumoniae]|nr:PTS system transporter subunit IIC [Streptococcus pneumoniae]VJW66508.1 PTS system transporter subunit IIC [Streptococcus pneumoniae]VLA43791.1 PTS system transporter subunit IIC [Streptococcus pneumoniae]VMD11996.1 PTS system transporter subunit IIC [Streptococcus pneumoniae]
MNTMLDKMQEKLSPIAMKVGNQKFLVALRDSFVGTMPVIMTGPKFQVEVSHPKEIHLATCSPSIF